MKRLDDLESKRERDAEFTGSNYTSRFSGKYKIPGSREDDEGIDKSELRWSNFRHLPADEMLLHIQPRVFLFLKDFNRQGADLANSKINLAKEKENQGNQLINKIVFRQ